MRLLVLTEEPEVDAVLPGLALLPHDVRMMSPTPSSVTETDDKDVVVVDARAELAAARSLCRLLSGATETPLIVVVAEGGLVAIGGEWGVSDFILQTAGPAEVDARLRLLSERLQADAGTGDANVLTLGELVIDEETYVARVRGKPLDLTYKEFELLKFLCQYPSRVFTRAHLLQEVWGYDFFGGTRTVDVHIRRLRAKLGPDHEALIGTVRNVGYKAVVPATRKDDRESD